MVKNRDSEYGVVYSTEHGRFCPDCGKAKERCECKKGKSRSDQPPTSIPNDGFLRLQRQTKGRGGKTVTVIQGFRLPPSELEKLCKALKNSCGTGGTAKDGAIEIQGDHREKIARLLEEKGYKTKLAGG